jgi:putative DNA primase/helicase
MREDFWEFDPTHKLVIAGNHWFFVKGTDEGIWRRIRVVPWLVTVEADKRDQNLPKRLRDEYPGILRWCVEGALAWQREGLAEPPEVLAATKQFREESDPIGQFIAEETIQDSEARCPADLLYGMYVDWCGIKNDTPLSARKFANRLRDRGLSNKSVRVGEKVMHGWAAVRPASAEEKAAKRWGMQENSKK